MKKSTFEENALNSLPGNEMFSKGEIKEIVDNIEKLTSLPDNISDRVEMGILFLRTGVGRLMTKNDPYSRKYDLTQKRVKELPFPVFSKKEIAIILSLFSWSKKIENSEKEMDKYLSKEHVSGIVFWPIHFVFIEKMMDISSTKLRFLPALEEMDIPDISSPTEDILPFVEKLREPDTILRNDLMLLGIRGGALNDEVANIIDFYAATNERKSDNRYTKYRENLESKRQNKKITSTLQSTTSENSAPKMK